MQNPVTFFGRARRLASLHFVGVVFKDGRVEDDDKQEGSNN
jgi:hypothetical protein